MQAQFKILTNVKQGELKRWR